MGTFNNIINKYMDSVDVDYSYKLSCELTKYKTNESLGYRTAGSKAEHEAADYLCEEMKKIGLSNVKKEPFKLDSWTFERGNANFVDLQGRTHDIEVGTYQINFDTEGMKKYKVVDGGFGTKQDLEKIDILGKLVIVHINQRENWWVNYPALQAKNLGAAGVILVQSAGFSEVSDDALNANDIIGPADMPVFSMKKSDAKYILELISKYGEAEINLDVKSTVTLDGLAYNVTGEIQGKDSESYIIFSSHYDAYFDGFQDNATAVGIMMGIAKALISTGYKPEKTIIFTSLAAEEWGTSNTRYDWSTGAYNQVFNIHPEWQGKAVLNINFELPAFLHNPFDEITAVNELETYLDNFINIVPNLQGGYTERTKIITPLTTWADDWSFSIGGIPAVRNDFTSSKFRESHYHTQFDNKDTYNEIVFKQHHILYGILALHYDYLTAVPLDFQTTIKKFMSSFNKRLLNDVNVDIKVIEQLCEKIDQVSIKLNNEIKSINEHYYQLKNNGEKHSEFYNENKIINNKILSTYRLIQDNLLKLDWEDEPYFPHEIIINNIVNLKSAINFLKNKEIENAVVKSLYNVDNNYLAGHFTKDVWDYFNDYVIKAPKEKLMWGVGRIISHIDLYDVIELLNSKSLTDKQL